MVAAVHFAVRDEFIAASLKLNLTRTRINDAIVPSAMNSSRPH